MLIENLEQNFVYKLRISKNKKKLIKTYDAIKYCPNKLTRVFLRSIKPNCRK